MTQTGSPRFEPTSRQPPYNLDFCSVRGPDAVATRRSIASSPRSPALPGPLKPSPDLAGVAGKFGWEFVCKASPCVKV